MQQSEIESMDQENETALLLKVLKPGGKIANKQGGHAMENQELQETLFAEIVIKELPAYMFDELLMDGTISGGTISKLENAVAVVSVQRALLMVD